MNVKISFIKFVMLAYKALNIKINQNSSLLFVEIGIRKNKRFGRQFSLQI